MGRNGRHSPPHPLLELSAPGATPEEAAAIAAAIEQFLRDTAPSPTPPSGAGRWLRAGLFEGAGLDPAGSSPWGDPVPWGR